MRLSRFWDLCSKICPVIFLRILPSTFWPDGFFFCDLLNWDSYRGYFCPCETFLLPKYDPKKQGSKLRFFTKTSFLTVSGVENASDWGVGRLWSMIFQMEKIQKWGKIVKNRRVFRKIREIWCETLYGYRWLVQYYLWYKK